VQVLYYAHTNATERKMERKDYTIKVFKFDKRCKTGELFMGHIGVCNG